MPRWFLSYHSPDELLASRLKLAITARDPSSTVFFAPQSLRAGGLWSPQLAQEIAEATAFILLIGASGVGPWQELEYYEALDRFAKSGRAFPMIVVLIEKQLAPGLSFMSQLHWIITADPTSEADLGLIFNATQAGGGGLADLWRYTSPYRGLEAMEEKDSDYFFGRTEETMKVLNSLAALGRVTMLMGNSGVGKSSLAKAGVMAALKRQAWPEVGGETNDWPLVFRESRQWCFLSLKPGVEPLKALVEAFIDAWQFGATDPSRVELRNHWLALLRDDKSGLSDLIDAIERRRSELGQTKPPGFLLYVDQGEELYVRAEKHQGQRFSQILVAALPDPRLHVMMSLRSDFLGELQKDRALSQVFRQINILPLSEAKLREVVSRPAALLGARFETAGLVDIISRRAAEDSIKDVGALPLLSYTLDDMWTQMRARNDGMLRLPAQSFELGGVLVARANAFLAKYPDSEAELRRILTLRCATVREDGEPTRRRADRQEFSDEEWGLVSELAAYPNRLLVTVTDDTTGQTYAEVAHEAIFRRWSKLREWIAAEREFLAWRSGVESARRSWHSEGEQRDALLMGVALAKAQNWYAKRADDLVAADATFINASISAARFRRLRIRAIEFGGIVLLCSFMIWNNRSVIWQAWHDWFVTRPFMNTMVRPYVLTDAAEQALVPKQGFRECADQGHDYCPEMIVVDGGTFQMGSAEDDPSPYDDERPQHPVTFAKPFAVSKFELTFEEWDTCISYGDCAGVSDEGWGRGRQPVINVSLDDAKRYTAWLSRMTGKPYRLLTEAEYEYAARAGTQTEYYWGDEIGENHANCADCGSPPWGGKQTAPVGSFAPNDFGLYDMVGNVYELIEDCYHRSYDNAPTDGSAWLGQCSTRVLRGGSWNDPHENLRSALRLGSYTGGHTDGIGFRVARALSRP